MLWPTLTLPLLAPSESRYYRLLDACVLARLPELAGADLVDAPEVVGDDRVLDVVLGHGDRLEEHGRDLLGAVVLLAVDQALGRLLATGDRHGELGRRLGERLDRLVDGHELLTGEDPLDRCQLGVLSRHRDLLRVDAGALHGGDRPAAGAV